MKNLSNAAFHANCPLCQVAHHERFSDVIKTKVYYEDNFIIVLDCRTCHVPMLVYKEHMVDLGPGMKNVFRGKFVELFGEGSGRYCDEMQSIKGHYHTHWRPL